MVLSSSFSSKSLSEMIRMVLLSSFLGLFAIENYGKNDFLKELLSLLEIEPIFCIIFVDNKKNLFIY